MKLFLDTSVLLAAAGSAIGASRYLIESAASQRWQLVSSPYCLAEVDKNVMKIGSDAAVYWRKHLHDKLTLVQDCVVLDKPLSQMEGKEFFNSPKITLSDLRGRVLIYDIFRTW